MPSFVSWMIIGLLTCMPAWCWAGEDGHVPADRDSFHLYLLIGQSNMAGRGRVEAHDLEKRGRVLTLTRAGVWEPAAEPLHFDKSVPGVGPGRSFGVQMANARPNITIGLIPCAVGGSPIDAWKPGEFYQPTNSHPWDDAVKRTRIALRSGVLKGVLWHQGESDAKPMLAETYAGKLDGLVERLRTEFAQPDLPVVVGQMGRFPERPWDQYKLQVDQAHQRLPERVARTAFVNSDGLSHKGDEVHFDSASYRELGRRYADVMLQLTAGPPTE